MPQRQPWAQSRGGYRHRTDWTTDDRRQVEELMVCWRHNVPAIEWERLARRMGRTAAALRAWVWRNRLPRLATAPVDGVAAAPDPGAVERRHRGRLERPEDRESRGADVGTPLGGLGLHAGLPIGPARSAAARGPRGESSEPATRLHTPTKPSA